MMGPPHFGQVIKSSTRHDQAMPCLYSFDRHADVTNAWHGKGHPRKDILLTAESGRIITMRLGSGLIKHHPFMSTRLDQSASWITANRAYLSHRVVRVSTVVTGEPGGLTRQRSKPRRVLKL